MNTTTILQMNGGSKQYRNLLIMGKHISKEYFGDVLFSG